MALSGFSGLGSDDDECFYFRRPKKKKDVSSTWNNQPTTQRLIMFQILDAHTNFYFTKMTYFHVI